MIETTAAKYNGLPITMGGHKEETTGQKYSVRICYANKVSSQARLESQSYNAASTA